MLDVPLTRLPRRQAALRGLGALLVLAGPLTALTPARAATPALPPIGHVWTVMLENSDFLVTFGGGQSTNPYIASTLPAMGALIPDYYGTGHNSLDNYLSMISGQAPNTKTKGDCSDASVLGGAAGVTFDADGQALLPRQAGVAVDPQTLVAPPDETTLGCTFPASVKTLPDQLDEAGVSWKGYLEDVDASPDTKRNTCQYAGSSPKPGQDQSTKKAVDLFARKHDPFVYFHSITDRLAYCDAHDVAEPQLTADLASIATTPQYSYITPNLCDDAHDGSSVQSCSDGGKGGLPRADDWAKVYIPQILASPAFKKDGLLILTVDEGSEAASCCGEPKGRNLPLTVDNGSESSGDYGTTVGRGGGMIGTVMISPFIKPGTIDTDPTGVYDHYSYLRSMEDIFHIGATKDIPGSDGQGHLGYAGTNAGSAPVVSYHDDIFTNPDGAQPPAATLPELHLPVLLPVLGAFLVAGSARQRRRRARR